MAEPLYRPLRETELAEAANVYLTARNDMHARLGSTPPPRDPAAAERDYAHLLRTGIFRVAEVDGRIGGICCAVVRDDLWFLSGFWVLPELQGKGLGGPLLRQVWQEGLEAGARTQFVWASSNHTAMASYLRLGMLPGYQIMAFSGRPTGMPEAPIGYDTAPLSADTAISTDRLVRGTGREADHRYWLGEAGFTGRQVLAGGRLAGYYYLNGTRLGATAWLVPGHCKAVLSLALREAAEAGPDPVRLLAPGACPDAVRFALDSGLKLTGFAHFLTTAAFGRPEQYLPSGPLLY